MHQSQQILSPTLSFDLESPTTMSLPSPGATSCSLDGPHEGGALSPPANVSRRRDSTSSEAPALQGRVNVLHRVSRWFDCGKQDFLINDHIGTNGIVSEEYKNVLCKMLLLGSAGSLFK